MVTSFVLVLTTRSVLLFRLVFLVSFVPTPFMYAFHSSLFLFQELLVGVAGGSCLVFGMNMKHVMKPFSTFPYYYSRNAQGRHIHTLTHTLTHTDTNASSQSHHYTNTST